MRCFLSMWPFSRASAGRCVPWKVVDVAGKYGDCLAVNGKVERCVWVWFLASSFSFFLVLFWWFSGCCEFFRWPKVVVVRGVFPFIYTWCVNDSIWIFECRKYICWVRKIQFCEPVSMWNTIVWITPLVLYFSWLPKDQMLILTRWIVVSYWSLFIIALIFIPKITVQFNVQFDAYNVFICVNCRNAINAFCLCYTLCVPK